MSWQLYHKNLVYNTIVGLLVKRPICFVIMKERIEGLSFPFPSFSGRFYVVFKKPVFGEMTWAHWILEVSTDY